MKKISSLLIAASASLLFTGCSTSKAASSASRNDSHTSTSEKSTDLVKFGKYQDEDIEWYVLDQENGKALLLSMHALDSRPFNDGPATWDSSSLRQWLNGEFFNTAFTSDEQKEVLLSALDNGDDLQYGTTVGENTEDHVFLLSASEAQNYLSKEQTVTSPTKYAEANGAYTNEQGNCAWWLRSPGMNEDGPAYYSSQGEIGTRAHKGSESIIGVRPAIWVNAEVVK